MKFLRLRFVFALCFWFLPAAAPVWGQKETSDTAPAGEARHMPRQPRSGEAVTVTAHLASPAKAVELEYQVVEPGQYIALKDPDYKTKWLAMPMAKAGAGGEGDYSAKIPESVQSHRRLVRYRVKATLADGRAVKIPAAEDPEPNFAWFVYDGVSGWKGAIQPKSGDPKRSEAAAFSAEAMGQVQNYILIGKSADVENATWREQSNDKDYKYTGTFVADGKVYDHIRYRARGGAWRHAMGKNMWKIDFNKGRRFSAKDDYGRPYAAKWSKLNLRGCIQQGDYGRRGEQGMYESVGFRLFNLAGVESPRTHWIALRIIDGKTENPANQYQGDFWGLYLAIENEDGHFLEEHGLPSGNIYKMMYGQGDLANHGANQVTNKTDLLRLQAAYQRGNSTEEWWRRNVDLPRYYSYRSILEAIHHYDISDGKNYDFYLNPESGKWQVIPWDIDLTWGDQMYGGGYEPFLSPVLSKPAFRIEYQNRLREIRDLLYNSDETDRLIDECAAIISKPGGAASIVDADRAKWDYHPIMISQFVMREKAGQGLFYQASRTGDFAGMVQQMKDYVKRRATYIDSRLIADPAAPAKPTLTYTGAAGHPANGLAFRASAFSGPGKFAAMQWRAGEIAPMKMSGGKPSEPGRYEITPLWESPEITEFKESMTLPSGAAKPGQTCRVRVRMKESGGRWSHWSDPAQFVAGPESK